MRVALENESWSAGKSDREIMKILWELRRNLSSLMESIRARFLFSFSLFWENSREKNTAVKDKRLTELKMETRVLEINW